MSAEHPWDVAADEVQLSILRAALFDSKGNITRAAAALGLARSHVMRLLKKYALTGYAVELRIADGGSALGAPRIKQRSR